MAWETLEVSAVRITAQHLRAIMPNVPEDDVEEYARAATNSANKFEINTPKRLAAWFGMIAYESGELNYWREIGADDREYAPYVGRGPIQLTWKYMYEACGKFLGIDLVNDPELVELDAQIGFDTAGWVIRYAGGNLDLNTLADNDNFFEYYMRIAGGDNGTYARRKEYYDMALKVFYGTIDGGDGKMIKAEDLVEACRLLRGIFYRTWEYGDVPMWYGLDGYGWGPYEQPDMSYMTNNGVMCSDLINWGLQYLGGYAIGGTGKMADAIEDWDYLDTSAPAVAGAIAVSPFVGPALKDQGHVLLYTGENSTIQALWSDGVTEKYSDAETVAQGIPLTYYGLLPGVDYSTAHNVDPIPPSKFVKSPMWIAMNKDGVLVAEGADYTRGWYDTGYKRGDWSWHGPKES